MIDSFKSYLAGGKAKRKTPDPVEAKALMERAADRLLFAKSMPISKQNAHFILEAAYEAVRETSQSFMSASGFKPYSHEATISFIREFRKEFGEAEIQEFDRFRQIRNDSVYRAIPVLEKDAEDCILFAENYLKKAKNASITPK